MSTTLLAVDDSVTMRKVIEITFAGEDYRVITAESADAALKKARSEKPAVVLLDVTLPGQDGYAVCRTLKSEMPGIGVVILSSKQGPYDPTRGAAAGADDFIDKPFDTTQMIEKVRKVSAQAKAAPTGASASPPVQPLPAATRAPEPAAKPSLTGTLPGASAGGASPRPATPAPAAAATMGRNTESFGAPAAAALAVKIGLGSDRPKASPNVTTLGMAPPIAARQQTAPSPLGSPTPSPPAEAQPPTRPDGVRPAAPTMPASQAHSQPAAQRPSPSLEASSPITAAVDGQMSTELSGLGLTPAQAEAVHALSREVIERVVWEVVPQLAETLIKEEIGRLTRE